MDPQEQLLRQKKSLESAEFERKLFEEQAKDLEAAIEARREEMKKAGDEAQRVMRGDTTRQDEYSQQDIEETREQQAQIEQINAQQQEVLQKGEIQHEQNQSFLENARAFLKEKGHAVDDEDLKLLKENKPQRPDFPLIMVSMAVVKDIFDMILTATLVGIILVMLYSFFYLVISFVWTMTRVARVSFVGKQAIKAVRNRAVKKWAARNSLELVPGVQVLPLATFFVLLTHYADTKLVQTFVKAAEMLEGMVPEDEE